MTSEKRQYRGVPTRVVQLAQRMSIFLLSIVISSSIALARSESCQDAEAYKAYCPAYASLGFCRVDQSNTFFEFMTINCMESCEFCKVKEDCKDSKQYEKECRGWKTTQFCEISLGNTHLEFMQQHCQKTCGFCVEPCKDTHPNGACNPKWKVYCDDTSSPYHSFVNEYCADMCGRCVGETSTGQKEQCGLRPSGRGRVVGGEVAKRNSWPWQALITWADILTCGGTLLTSEWVLTAAHCFEIRVLSDEDMKLLNVILGEHDRDIIDDAVEQIFEVAAIHTHPKYNGKLFQNDIALVKLSRPAELNVNVTPACLPESNDRIPDNRLCFVTGWGKLGHQQRFSSVLQQADLPVIEWDKCQAQNKARGVSLDVTEDMFCAGFDTPGTIQTACQGDSGGPFVCNKDHRWHVEGITSFGSASCNATERHAIFTRVSSYADWIQSIMDGNEAEIV